MQALMWAIIFAISSIISIDVKPEKRKDSKTFQFFAIAVITSGLLFIVSIANL